MDSDRSLVKWAIAAVLTVVGCFLLGYFLVPWGKDAAVVPEPSPAVTRRSASETRNESAPPPARLQVSDITAQKREERRRREEELRQAAERAEAQDAAGQDGTEMSVALEPDASVPPADADSVSEGQTTATPTDSRSASEPLPASNAQPQADKPSPKAEPTASPASDNRSRESVRDRQDSVKPGEKPPRNVGRRSDDSNRKRVAARTTKRAASLDKPASRKKPPTPGSRRETALASGLSAPSKRTEVADGGRKRLTRVRVGGRAIPRERAERTVASLRSEGFSPALLPDGKGFVVQVGAFRDRKGAEAVADQLRSKGFFPSLR